MDLNNIVINFNKIINLYEYRIKENKKINDKIDIINNNLINTVNNNDSMFKNRLISDKDYSKNLNNIEDLIKKLMEIKSSNKVSNNLYYNINLKINNLFKEILLMNENISSIKITDILDIFDLSWKII